MANKQRHKYCEQWRIHTFRYQIGGGGGGGNSDPEIREGPAFGPQFGLKIRAGGGAGPPVPSPGSANGEWFEPRSHFMSRLSLIVRVYVVLNRTVVDSD